jgi:mRNA-degrading endonuclease RelE of RelBE toxin-antitoxin system
MVTSISVGPLSGELVMAIKKGFQIDRRVGIAMDALSPAQKAALKLVLQNKEGFVAHSNRPGVTKKLSASKPLYSMRAGGGMRIIFTVQDENIVVRDIMRKATLDQFVTKRSGKAHTSKKKGQGETSAKRAEAVKANKV